MKGSKPKILIHVILITFLFPTLMTPNSTAVTITVPDDYSTIQLAIDVANPGDTVYVRAGTYSPSTNGEVFPINMKNGVSLVGAGPDGCILDAEGDNTVINCSNISDTTSKIKGFTITHGFSSPGGTYGGIYCWRSSPTITNNVITRNLQGGGIYCSSYSSPTITNNVISENYGDGTGGIYYSGHSSPTITNNVITGNWVNHGGGIWCSDYSSPTIINNVITRNIITEEGGGIYCSGSSPTITNNVITRNIGGGYYGGGGICCRYYSFPTITYDDVWDNTPDNYSDCTPGVGCISADPLFVNADIGDYHLQEGSRCIDAGTNDALALPETDFDGNPRILDGDGDGIRVTDMGAYEFVTPKEKIEILIDDIIEKVNSGELNKGRGKALTSTLERALERLKAGQNVPACNQLRAFINQVAAFIRRGLLTEEEGQAMIEEINEVISELTG